VPATFLIVPEWQGSSSSRAMRLIDGAEAIAGDLPASALRVEVPLGAGEPLETGLRRYSSVAEAHRNLRAALDEHAARPGALEPVVVIGGDAGSDLAAIARAARTHPGMALVWLSAHAGLRSPRPGADGAPGGVALADAVLPAVLGDGPAPPAAAGPERMAAERIVLAGVRALDDDGLATAARLGLRLPEPEAADTGPTDALVRALEDLDAASVYLHVDLDVLDTSAISAVDDPEPFGPDVDELTSTLRALRSRFETAGAAVTGFAPADRAAAERDLPTVLRILGALTGPLS